MADAVDSDAGKSRRDLLKALSAAAAGAVAGGVLKAGEAEAAHATTINAVSNSPAPAIHGDNTDNGPGVEGTSLRGPGVQGFSDGVAVHGRGRLIGVEGFSTFGQGVQGWSGHGIGVEGVSTEGVAVQAAGNEVALRVIGRPEFFTAGSGVIPANQESTFVAQYLVTEKSHITVTLTGDPGQAASAPGSKAAVAWVERPVVGPVGVAGFVVHLSRKVVRETPFTYLIVEPYKGD